MRTVELELDKSWRWRLGYLLRFKGGDAHVVPPMIANYDDVGPVIEELSQPR